MHRVSTGWMVAVLAAWSLLGCGTGDGPTDVPGADAPDATGDTTAVDPGEADVALPPTAVDEDFRLVLLRVDTGGTRYSLVLFDPRTREWEEGGTPIGIAGPPQDEDGPASANPDIDCRLGCFTDPGMRWFAYLEEVPGTVASTRLVAGTLGKDLVFTPFEGDGIPDVTAAAFAGEAMDQLFFSQRMPNCEAETGSPQTCWVFRRMDMNVPGVLATLFSFPTAKELGKSAHAGHFTVSRDASTVVVQDPRSETLRLWVWRQAATEDGGTFAQHGEIVCGSRLDDAQRCTSSPGLFTDHEPLAVSADGHLVVLAAVEHDEALRLLTLDLEGDDVDAFTRSQVAYIRLAADSEGFRENAYINRQTAPFTAIQPNPRFTGTGDDDERVLVAERASPNVDDKEHKTTNLAAIPVAALRAGNADGLAPIRRITTFVTGNVPANVLIPDGGFDLSPEGNFIPFLGTPVLRSGGEPITDPGELQHVNDQEVHVTRRDGTTAPVQVTGHLATRTWGLQAVTTP